MIVYIVYRVCDYEYGCTEVVGVYATREQAEAYIEAQGGEGSWTHWMGGTYPIYSIDEEEVIGYND